MLHSQPTVRWLSLMTLIAMAFILSPFWMQSQSPAFRDGFHFYTPQLAWLDECYETGEYFPAWNPAEGLGSSVAGQPTWQLYYPLRIIWFFPFLSLFQRLALFFAVHLALGIFGMLRLRNVLNLSHPSTWFGAIAFTFSCPMLFQVNNLIYLCSATWIAWSLAPLLKLSAAWREMPAMSISYYIRQLLELLAIGCLMTLSGDPHTAANLCILLIMVIVYATCSRWFTRSQAEARSRSFVEQQPANSVASLLPILGLTIALLVPTTFQVRATSNWYRLSSRTGQPTLVQDSFHPHVNAILQDDEWDQVQHTFDFSLSPWNLPSLVWPTWGGHFQPTHSRWLQAIRSEARMWLPSIYAGILPALLALSMIFQRHSTVHARILRVVFWFALAAAMGNFSLGWILRNAIDVFDLRCTLPPWLGDIRGSLYGLMTQAIPGYSSFRYPAKWLIWCTAALAVLGSMGLEQFLNSEKQVQIYRLSSLAILAGVAASFGLLVVTQVPASRQALTNWLQLSDDRMLGSPDARACCHALYRSWLQPSILILLAGVASWHCRRIGTTVGDSQRPRDKHNRLAIVVVALTLIDLTSLAGKWITTTACNTSLVRAIPNSPAVRCWANVGLANLDLVVHSPNQPTMDDTLELQRQFRIGKLSLLTGESALHATGSIEPWAVVKLKRWLVQHDELIQQQPELDRVLLALGVNRRLYQASDGSLAWQEIGADRTCELLAATADNVINWHWQRTDCLEIQMAIDSSAKLLIRQFNDSQWQVRDENGVALKTADHELFVVCDVPAGTHKLKLSRR